MLVRSIPNYEISPPCRTENQPSPHSEQRIGQPEMIVKLSRKIGWSGMQKLLTSIYSFFHKALKLLLENLNVFRINYVLRQTIIIISHTKNGSLPEFLMMMNFQTMTIQWLVMLPSTEKAKNIMNKWKESLIYHVCFSQYSFL